MFIALVGRTFKVSTTGGVVVSVCVNDAIGRYEVIVELDGGGYVTVPTDYHYSIGDDIGIARNYWTDWEI